jgi:hypothetical protein
MSSRKKKISKSNIVIENINPDLEESSDMSLTNKTFKKNKSVEQLRHTMDIARRNISMIIDNLDGENSDEVLKKNVVIAIKHLKQIENLLDVT